VKDGLGYWLLLVPIVIGVTELGYLISSQQTPVYQATTSVVVGGVLQNSDLTKDDLDASQQLALVYADAVSREPVLAGLVKETRLKTSWQSLRGMVQAAVSPNDPQLIDITAEASTPHVAKEVADAVPGQLVALGPGKDNQAAGRVQSFVRSQLTALQQDIARAQAEIAKLRKRAIAASPQNKRRFEAEIATQRRLINSGQGNYSSLLSSVAAQGTPNSIQTLVPAEVDPHPVSPNVTRSTILAGAIGIILAFSLIYPLQLRTTRRRTDSANVRDAPTDPIASNPNGSPPPPPKAVSGNSEPVAEEAGRRWARGGAERRAHHEW
jgi:capsular polysaccharide biosynthesis protein